MNDFVEIQGRGRMITVPKIHRQRVHNFAPFLEGSRRWLANGDFQFEATIHNCRKALEAGVMVIMKSPLLKSPQDSSELKRPEFKSPLADLEHQTQAAEKFEQLNKCAYFAEMGTGKTKMAIDRVNREWCRGTIDAVIVLAKKGVHIQWANGEVGEDEILMPSPIDALTQKDLPHDEWAWKNKPVPVEMLAPDQERIVWFTFNFDAIIHQKARVELDKIMAAYTGRIAFIGDETHYLKSHRARRSKAAVMIAAKCSLRIIMTGTPIAKNLEDEWSQFKVLSEGILGHRYVTAFRNEYCVMGGFEGRCVVGAKNLDRFKTITAPYVFRVKKSECLDLPEKQYRQVNFTLSKEQQQAIMELKKTQGFTLSTGEEVFFEGAAPVLGKIQEVSNGFLSYPGGIEFFPNPRQNTIQEFLEDVGEKVVIWCRFRQDVHNLIDTFKDQALDYFGGTSDKNRREHKAAFINDPDVKYLIATTGAMGEGVDGLQGACSLACYYSNNFNSIQRWQSEDRIHRIGMGDKAVYVDFIARGCIDNNVLRNLRDKANFSKLVLDVGRSFGLEEQGAISETSSLDWEF